MEDAGPTIVGSLAHDFFPLVDQLTEEAITERLVGIIRPQGQEIRVTAAAGRSACCRRLVRTEWDIPLGVGNDPIAVLDFDEAGGRVSHEGLGVVGVPPAANARGAGKAGDGDGVLEGKHVNVRQGRNICRHRWGEGQRHGYGFLHCLDGDGQVESGGWWHKPRSLGDQWTAGSTRRLFPN